MNIDGSKIIFGLGVTSGCSNGSYCIIFCNSLKINYKENFIKSVSAINEFKITQIVDNGQIIQLTLIENISTEPISQKQMIIENVSKKLRCRNKRTSNAIVRSNFTSTTNCKY